MHGDYSKGEAELVEAKSVIALLLLWSETIINHIVEIN